jgi:hypothetical protein
MHDEATLGIKLADRVHSFHERALARDALERRAPHARHELHVEHDVRAVGDFYSAPRKGESIGPMQ